MDDDYQDDFLMENGDFEGEEDEKMMENSEEYQILSTSDLSLQMSTVIQSLETILPLSPGILRVLLQKFKFNKDALIDHFFSVDQNISNSKLTVFPDEDYCSICCSEEAEPMGLECGHVACEECWGFYLMEKIKNGKSEIECIGECGILLADEEIQKVLDFENFEKFKVLTLKNYVDSSSSLTWCIGANCEKIIKSECCQRGTVACSCGTRFCFQCSAEPHEPVSCQMLKKWNKKTQESKFTGESYSSDPNTYSWILIYTKDCPKCMTAIEKNGGCNKITCNSQKCKFQFCWLCMKDWNVHGHYPCNSYSREAEKNRIDARAELIRFTFYLNRFNAHQQSLELEKKLIETVNAKMEQLGTQWIDFSFLPNAVDTLSKCRRTLMYTYPLAYYLERTNHAIMFESNQKDLEEATEQLSGYLEQEMEMENLKTLAQKLQDKCRYVEHRRRILLEHCAEGVTVDTVGLEDPSIMARKYRIKFIKDLAMTGLYYFGIFAILVIMMYYWIEFLIQVFLFMRAKRYL